MKTSILACVIVFALSTGLRAQDSVDGLWKPVVGAAPLRADAKSVQPDAFRLFTLNLSALKEILRQAPLEGTTGVPSVLPLPTPDGMVIKVRVREAVIVEPALAAKFPELKAYRGEIVDQPGATVQLDLTPSGFRAQVLAPQGAFYVVPSGGPDEYKIYFRRDYRRGSDFRCLVKPGPKAAALVRHVATRSGQELRTYRLAVACTGEYAAFHGGTVAGAMAAIFNTINFVDGLYERDLAIRLVLVGNNDRIIFTDPLSDGFDNTNSGTLMGQAQTKIDTIIKDPNYDVGHTFSTESGGEAGVCVVCRSGQKALGVSGWKKPVGPPFDVDYVAHELGHQFGAHHTFNGIGGYCAGFWDSEVPVEPGSGSTIMAYAGLCCGDDLQTNDDSYFHSASLDEINSYIINSGNCLQQAPTGNNPPTVDAGPDRVIPKKTPFVLTANGYDPDGDPLKYCWEQREQGEEERDQARLDKPDNGIIPLFRSFEPTPARERYFPRLTDLLANTPSLAEKLPTLARTMNFRVTVRDQRVSGGGVNGDDVAIRVAAGAGPFKVRAPNGGESRSGAVTVTWDVAHTNVAPVNTSRVNILLSLDGGLTFRDTLAAGTSNDGSQAVMLPDSPTTTARIKVAASDNIFFDVSDSNFTIVPTGRALVVMVTEENTPVERIAEVLGSVNVDTIYTSKVTRKFADAIAQQRGISVAGTVEKEMLTTIQSDPSQRRILLLIPRAEIDALVKLLNASIAGPNPPETPILLYSGALSESASVLRLLDF